MPHQKHILCGLIILWSGLVTSAGLKAAGPVKDAANWNNLKELTSGEEVQVVLNDAKSYRGTFQGVTDDALLVRLSEGDRSFERGNTLRVSAKGKSHRLRKGVLAALIGLGGGAGIGAAAGRHSGQGWPGTTGAGAAIGAAIGLGGGAAVGAALPIGGWREVYRAR